MVKNGKPVKLLEIKCPYDLQSTEQEVLEKKCKFLRLEKGKMILKKKHAYYAQIQFGMALLNLQCCDFVIYSSILDAIKIINVTFEKEYACDFLVTLKTRYFEKMLHQICLLSRVL